MVGLSVFTAARLLRSVTRHASLSIITIVLSERKPTSLHSLREHLLFRARFCEWLALVIENYRPRQPGRARTAAKSTPLLRYCGSMAIA
jgi:hypothetical protein